MNEEEIVGLHPSSFLSLLSASSGRIHRAFSLLLPVLATMLGFLSLSTHLMLGFLSLNTHLLRSRPPVALLVFLPLFWVPVFSADSRYEACGAYDCGLISIRYPFAVDDQRPEFCTSSGFNLNCTNNTPLLNLNNQLYQVKHIDYQTSTISVVAESIINTMECPNPRHNVTLDNSPFEYSAGVITLLVYTDCPASLRSLPPATCLGENSFAMPSGAAYPDDYRRCRFLVEVPVLESSDLRLSSDSYAAVVEAGFNLSWTADGCAPCTESGGRCGYNQSPPGFMCFCEDRPYPDACPPLDTSNNHRMRQKMIIIIVLSATFGTFLLAAFFYSAYTYKKKKRSNSLLLTRAISSEPSSKGEYKSSLQQSMIHVSSITVFTYEELEEATINFSPSKELGDGGFGTVYLGKLRDGRLVAIKRLYENNCKQVEQFMNEIKILSSARHPNLVCLYGCTSRHSRELLLVYEYMPNGTVADHLHGDGSKSKGVLSWKIRMSIAIETADALAYLHSIEPPIIHRDVKTNNILLDNNFRVKVADFGMSRLFPLDVTHVSTAPLGTPGYVDPDYHQCYQLTDKSDVYSFGVVLAELISGKPAVDIARHRHEINLATMAINKIQNRTLHELVDPEIGFESDPLVKKMVTLVAELTFRCLSLEKDLRPTMEEVAAALRLIESNDEEMKKMGPEVFGGEEVNLLKSYPPCSPDSVTDKWVSRNTTPNSSS